METTVQDDIFKKILQIVEQKTGMEIDSSANFLSLGGNSIVAAQIIGEINQAFSVELQVGSMLDAENIGDFIGHAIAEVQVKASVEVAGGFGGAVKLGRHSGDKWPLTSDQERIWFLDRMKPGNPAFNIYSAIRIKGEFSIDALKTSYNYLLARHAILRARFAMEEGKIYQIIDPLSERQIPVDTIKEEELDGKLREAASAGMDLSKPDSFKLHIYQINETDRILFIVIHHIISDAWSLGILMNDLLQKYSLTVAGSAEGLEPLNYEFSDFIQYQTEVVNKNLEAQLGFWKENLAGMPHQINLPYDLKRPEVLSYQAGHRRFEIDEALFAQIKDFSKSRKVTVFNFLYTAFTTLLYKISDQPKFLIGCPIANRKLPDLDKIVGFFTNTLVMKNQFSQDSNFLAQLQLNREISTEAFNNSDVPYINIVKSIADTREYNYNPLFQVMFSMLQSAEFPENDKTSIEYVDLFSGFSDYDIFMTVEVGASRISGSFNYSRDVFIDSTAALLVSDYIGLIREIIGRPDIALGEYKVSAGLGQLVDEYQKKNHKQKIIVSSSFSDQPLQGVISFWMDKIAMPTSVILADYNSVFNQLLDGSELMARNRDGCNVLLIRIGDWVRYSDNPEDVHQSCDQFIGALSKFAENSAVPIILSVLPDGPGSSRLPESVRLSLADKVISEFSESAKVMVLKFEEILLNYPMEDIFDDITDKEGHLPFTDGFYDALGTSVARKVYAIKEQPFKVIVLDCDNTLWQGVIAEDGIDSIVIDAARKTFQELMVKQQEKGMLLCLASKNEPEDIVKVFKQKPEMALRLEHITLIKANWQPKPENVKEIAKELNLGVDSFIFIDDNPMECAEMASVLPEVLTVAFPQDAEGIGRITRQCWFWDHPKVTEADGNRTKMYQQDISRKSELKQHITFADFYRTLNLTVDIREVGENEIARVSQLTQRTNQFNSTKIVRTEADIAQFLSDKANSCFSVSASDRFGSYGLIGGFFCTVTPNHVLVDSILLSCRVLGKGVEYRMLQRIAEFARANSRELISIPYVSAPRNEPILNFLNRLGYQKRESENGQVTFQFSAQEMAGFEFDPDANQIPQAQEDEPKEKAKNRRRVGNQALLDIASTKIPLINLHQSTVSQLAQPTVSPENDIQEKLVSLVKSVLKIETIGIENNFFELGGYSIQLVQLLSVIQKEFNITLEITDLFQYTNIRKLSEFISKGDNDDKLREIKLKGEMQRQRILNLRN